MINGINLKLDGKNEWCMMLTDWIDKVTEPRDADCCEKKVYLVLILELMNLICRLSHLISLFNIKSTTTKNEEQMTCPAVVA